MTLEEYKSKAMEIRAQGYNCAQTVLLTFEDRLPLDAEMLSRIGAPLGLGAAVRELCGVVSGMDIALGLLNPGGPKSKITAMAGAKDLAASFMQREGALRCANLKGGPDKKPCNDLILDGVEILFKALPE